MEVLNLMDRLEAVITSGTRVPVTGRVLLDLDKALKVLDQLRLALPKDVQEADEILVQREAIINQSYMEARRIKSSADDESRSKLDDTEIVKNARAKADEILAIAKRDAEVIMKDAGSSAEACRGESDRYAQDVLYNLEQQVSTILATVRRGLDMLESDQGQELRKVG